MLFIFTIYFIGFFFTEEFYIVSITGGSLSNRNGMETVHFFFQNARNMAMNLKTNCCQKRVNLKLFFLLLYGVLGT